MVQLNKAMAEPPAPIPGDPRALTLELVGALEFRGGSEASETVRRIALCERRAIVDDAGLASACVNGLALLHSERRRVCVGTGSKQR